MHKPFSCKQNASNIVHYTENQLNMVLHGLSFSALQISPNNAETLMTYQPKNYYKQTCLLSCKKASNPT